jgi:outer membrane protein assembly factor BamB
MKDANRWIGAIAGGVVLIGASISLAQDWPQWRGVNRDGRAADFTAPATWPKELTQSWKVTVGVGSSAPALVGERLYVFSRQDGDEVTSCLSAADGKEIWQNKFAVEAITGPDAREHDGPRSSPAVADGKVVTLGVWGNLACLDAADGKVLWRNNEFPKITPKFHAAMSPLILDGMAFAHLGGAGNGALMAFDLATGNVKWKWTAEGPAYASPVVMTVDGVRQIVTMTEKSVVGVAAADGKLLWQIAFVPEGRAYNAATPIVDGQTVIFSGQGRGTKAVKVEKTRDGFEAKELWSAKPAVQFCSPVLTRGLLFAMSGSGNLFCLDAKTGETGWTDSAKRGTGYGGMVDAGSVVLALDDKSELTAFKPNEKNYEEVARIKVAPTPTFAYPVVAGKRLFVKDRDALILWTLE